MERLSPKPELLVGQSIEVARNAEQSARDFLSRHADLIGPTLTDLIAQREAQSAFQEYGKRRLEGHANDDYSHNPGITAYVTSEAKARVTEMCKREGYPVAEEHVQVVTENMWALRFPRGVYGMGMGGCQFYQEAADDYERSRKAEKPFALGYNDVIRVEGDSNELWQNVNYNWDGTPKQNH